MLVQGCWFSQSKGEKEEPGRSCGGPWGPLGAPHGALQQARHLTSSCSTSFLVRPSPRRFKWWWIGLITFFIGTIANFVSFAFAAQSLLAALGEWARWDGKVQHGGNSTGGSFRRRAGGGIGKP